MFILWLFITISNIFLPSQVDPCQLYGTVFIESSRTYVDYIIYEEESEAFADLMIYKQENQLFADGQGLWHITKDRSFADFTIYITTKKNQADFTIFYTDTESFAGCR